MAIKLRTVGEFRNAILQLRKYADGFDAQDGFDMRKLRGDLNHPDPRDPRHFDNPLTKSQRAKVARYFDELQKHAGYKGVQYQHFRDPKKLREAQKAMGMPSRATWRGVFVPKPSEEVDSKLVKRGKGKGAAWVVEYKTHGVDKVFVPFDRLLLAEYDLSYVRGLFHDLPGTFQYSLAMGNETREVWRHAGNLEQMLRYLNSIVNAYGNFSDFVLGCWVYRGGQQNFNEVKRELYRTEKTKRAQQSEVKKAVARERRRLKDYEEFLRLSRKYKHLKK